MLYPTINDFRDYSGENIANKLAGDIKEPDKLFRKLMERCEMVVKTNLVGIQDDDYLTATQITEWKKILMEQAEYFLSVGDPGLMDGIEQAKTQKLSPYVMSMAIMAELWSRQC